MGEIKMSPYDLGQQQEQTDLRTGLTIIDDSGRVRFSHQLAAQ
jgi:hypothetical protein